MQTTQVFHTNNNFHLGCVFFIEKYTEFLLLVLLLLLLLLVCSANTPVGEQHPPPSACVRSLRSKTTAFLKVVKDCFARSVIKAAHKSSKESAESLMKKSRDMGVLRCVLDWNLYMKACQRVED